MFSWRTVSRSKDNTKCSTDAQIWCIETDAAAILVFARKRSSWSCMTSSVLSNDFRSWDIVFGITKSTNIFGTASVGPVFECVKYRMWCGKLTLDYVPPAKISQSRVSFKRSKLLKPSNRALEGNFMILRRSLSEFDAMMEDARSVIRAVWDFRISKSCFVSAPRRHSFTAARPVWDLWFER